MEGDDGALLLFHDGQMKVASGVTRLVMAFGGDIEASREVTVSVGDAEGEVLSAILSWSSSAGTEVAVSVAPSAGDGGPESASRPSWVDLSSFRKAALSAKGRR